MEATQKDGKSQADHLIVFDPDQAMLDEVSAEVAKKLQEQEDQTTAHLEAQQEIEEKDLTANQ